jgi:hypothetical protein
MQKTQVIAHFLVPPNQHAPEAIHPTMGAFYDPAPGFETRFVLEHFGFFAPRKDGGREAKLDEEVAHLVIVIAFVQTHPLGSVCGRSGPLDGNTLDGLPRQLEIIAIRSSDRKADGHPAAVGEETAFGADLAAVRGVLAHLFPPRAGLGSSPHPSRARPS